MLSAMFSFEVEYFTTRTDKAVPGKVKAIPVTGHEGS
jgi:hypothetical protein